ncbi:MAG: hypothetical protein MZW92_34845 [Comamonadaceae bacterium]|nr:hypothetical protein [Comamonadaceae bacterium]
MGEGWLFNVDVKKVQNPTRPSTRAARARAPLRSTRSSSASASASASKTPAAAARCHGPRDRVGSSPRPPARRPRRFQRPMPGASLERDAAPTLALPTSTGESTKSSSPRSRDRSTGVRPAPEHRPGAAGLAAAAE